jgi:hypothetical protein
MLGSCKVDLFKICLLFFSYLLIIDLGGLCFTGSLFLYNFFVGAVKKPVKRLCLLFWKPSSFI